MISITHKHGGTQQHATTETEGVNDMTMNQIKKAAQQDFVAVYGFAPAQKAMIPLESCGRGNQIDFLAFCVGNIGYTYRIGEGLERAEQYDLEVK